MNKPLPLNYNRSAADRGDADRYYHRAYAPNLIRDGVEIHEDDMTPEEIAEYGAAYEAAESGEKDYR